MTIKGVTEVIVGFIKGKKFLVNLLRFLIYSSSAHLISTDGFVYGSEYSSFKTIFLFFVLFHNRQCFTCVC